MVSLFVRHFEEPLQPFLSDNLSYASFYHRPEEHYVVSFESLSQPALLSLRRLAMNSAWTRLDVV